MPHPLAFTKASAPQQVNPPSQDNPRMRGNAFPTTMAASGNRYSPYSPSPTTSPPQPMNWHPPNPPMPMPYNPTQPILVAYTQPRPFYYPPYPPPSHPWSHTAHQPPPQQEHIHPSGSYVSGVQFDNTATIAHAKNANFRTYRTHIPSTNAQGGIPLRPMAAVQSQQSCPIAHIKLCLLSNRSSPPPRRQWNRSVSTT